jgi:carboxyl-terminal processing protease
MRPFSRFSNARAVLALSVLPALMLPSFVPSDARAADAKEAKEGKEGKDGRDAKQSAIATQQDRYKNLELFQKVLHFIEQNYVDDDKVKNKELIYGAIKGMMETLDPHSNFLTPEVWKDMRVDTSGKFGGLGIEIGVRDNVLTVISPIEDTPAWNLGIKPGDRVVKIGGESTRGMSLVEAVQKMRGKKGSEVVLSLYRKGRDKIRDIKITRAEIKVQSVKSEELEPGYGYVRLSNFNENAAQDIKKAIDKIEGKGKQKLRGLVFDMRGNPGGLLEQAVDVTSLFLDEGVVVSTIPRNKDQKEVKYARKGSARKDLTLAVLVSSNSASAAEIVAGALQDHRRAVIMGQPTFGKGSVQTVVPLSDDGNEDSATVGLKLTIARYFTPSGKSIQDRGVMPDILLDEYDPKLLAEAKRKNEVFRERDLKGHMTNPDEDGGGKKDKDSGGDFNKEELDSLAKEDAEGKAAGGKKKQSKDAKDASDDDMAPLRVNPKEDYQVREALNHLKSYEIFKHLAGGTAARDASGAAEDKKVSQK